MHIFDWSQPIICMRDMSLINIGNFLTEESTNYMYEGHSINIIGIFWLKSNQLYVWGTFNKYKGSQKKFPLTEEQLNYNMSWHSINKGNFLTELSNQLYVWGTFNK